MAPGVWDNEVTNLVTDYESGLGVMGTDVKSLLVERVMT